MAQTSNYAALNRIDELFDMPNSQAKVALLKLRSANWRVVQSRSHSCGNVDQELLASCQARRQEVLAIGGPLVEAYLRYIDGAAREGI